MTDRDETIRVLKEAVLASPSNVELRRHLADLLRAASRHEEAILEYREGLKGASADVRLKLGLAHAYYALGRDSHAGVVLESLLAQEDAPAESRRLMARIRLREGDVPGAVSMYQQALDQDPELADPGLSAQLGVPAGEITEDPADEMEGDDEDEIVEGRLRSGGGAGGRDPSGLVERPSIDFSDVGGMEPVKEEIDIKVIQPMRHPELYQAYGKAVGGGILMYGPPGCGKTHLARATAGQVDAKYMVVGLSDVLDMWIGQSERNLHALFDRARDHTPFVLFFDEVDALGASRGDMRGNSMRMVVNQFLEELDGAKNSNDGVLILAATNAPWHLDSAFRRPGRFDRILFVPPPDEPARASILSVLLKGKPTRDVDTAKLAKKTDGFSGADLKGLVDLAVEEKLREAMRDGVPKPLLTKDLLRATKSIKPTTRDWFATARNYVLYSNEGGLYDDVARYMNL